MPHYHNTVNPWTAELAMEGGGPPKWKCDFALTQFHSSSWLMPHSIAGEKINDQDGVEKGKEKKATTLKAVVIE